MGAITFGLDFSLVNELKRLLPLDLFVETGTFHGDTLAAALPLFEHSYSVELSPEYFARAVDRFAGQANVTLKLGDATVALAEWRAAIGTRGCLYFLDAHGCLAEHSAGQTSHCGLLDELRAIESLNESSVVVIDDARLVVAPPSLRQANSQWPQFDEILDSLRSLSRTHRIVIWNDVILCYPASIHKALVPWLADHGTDWLELVSQARADASAAAERLLELDRKEAEIQHLSEACRRRLELVNRLTRELELIRR